MLRWMIPLCLLLPSLTATAKDHEPRPRLLIAKRLTSKELSRIERGEIVTRYWKIKGTSIGTGIAAGLVDASAEKVFQIIVDVGRYKEFIERVVESRVTRKDNKHYYFYYEINMPWPLSDYWFETKNRNSWDYKRRVYRRSWTLVKGSFKRNDGYWHVQHWRDGRALVVYSSALEPRSAVPQFIINYATKKSLPRSISNIRKRVKQLLRASKKKSSK